VSRENEGHFILIKRTIHQEEISIFNILAPNTQTPTYIKKRKTLLDLRTQTEPNAVIVGDLNTPLSPLDRSSRQEINKETSELLPKLEQMEIKDIYSVFQPATSQYVFFSAAHQIFSKTDHSLEHKANRNKFKKIKITPCIRSDHNGIKLDFKNSRKNPQKIVKHMETEQCTAERQVGN
jgi:exonuclease III